LKVRSTNYAFDATIAAACNRATSEYGGTTILFVIIPDNVQLTKKYTDSFDLMGFPPYRGADDHKFWRFEPVRSLQLAGQSLRSARFVQSSGRYLIYADKVGGYGSGQTTLCYDFPSVYGIQTTYQMDVNYDIYCFDLHTAPYLSSRHNGMGYSTSVLVRLVEQQSYSSVLLDAVLAAPGHSFTDTSKGIKVTVESITKEMVLVDVVLS
jgi:hypothetical protein